MTTPGPTTPNGPSSAGSPSGIPGIGAVSAVDAAADLPTATATPVVSLAVTEKKGWAPRPNEVLSPEQKEMDELTDEELEALTQESISKGVLGGASAVVAAALGLVSISGTWLGTLLQQRQQLIGNIATSSKAAADQIKAGYTDPWHLLAAWNGVFALVAVLVGGFTVFGGRYLSAKELPSWVRAVAWAGVVLGVIGLFISAAIYFDFFTAAIKPPASSTSPTG
jgi:hypothetical protein